MISNITNEKTTISPYEALKLAKELYPKRSEFLEKCIVKNAYWAVIFAREVLNERFELGEKEIATSGYCSLHYAKYVLEDRFIPGEEQIATSPSLSISYAKSVLEGRFESGEPMIYQSRYFARDYEEFLATLPKEANVSLSEVEQLMNKIDCDLELQASLYRDKIGRRSIHAMVTEYCRSKVLVEFRTFLESKKESK